METCHGRTVPNVSKKPFNPCLVMSRTIYLQLFRSIKRYNLVSVSACSVQFDFLRRYSSSWLLLTCPVWYKVWMISRSFMQWGEFFSFFFKLKLHCTVSPWRSSCYFGSSIAAKAPTAELGALGSVSVCAWTPGASRRCSQASVPSGSMRVTVKIN